NPRQGDRSRRRPDCPPASNLIAGPCPSVSRMRAGFVRPAIPQAKPRDEPLDGETPTGSSSTRAGMIRCSGASSSVGTNRYAYAFNDPINGRDPTGHHDGGETETDARTGREFDVKTGEYLDEQGGFRDGYPDSYGM